MRHIAKIYYVAELLFFFVFKLIQANFQMAYLILFGKVSNNQRIMPIKIHIQSNIGRLIFSNLVSMTPGTLSIDLDTADEMLFVHVLNAENKAVMNDLDQLQRKIKKITH